jgi:hypothetical protein
VILAVNFFAPADAIGNAVVGAIGKAISAGMASFADWAVKGMVNAMVATTQVSFTGWFAGPWRGMVAVAAFLSLPILLAGTIQAVLAGQPGEAAKRAFIAPFQVAVGVGVGLAVSTGVLPLVDAACALLVQVALGADMGSAFSRIPTDLAGVTAATGGAVGSGLPGLAAFLLAGLAGVAAMVIWVELLLRSLLVYLVVAFVPLGLAGLFWRETSRWLRRLVEFGAAVALSQLVIVAVMTMAAADLQSGTLKGGSPGQDLNVVMTGIGLLILGSFSLPLALKVVPHAAEAAIAAGAGGRLVSRTGPVGQTMSDLSRFANHSGQGQIDGVPNGGPPAEPGPSNGDPAGPGPGPGDGGAGPGGSNGSHSASGPEGQAGSGPEASAASGPAAAGSGAASEAATAAVVV